MDFFSIAEGQSWLSDVIIPLFTWCFTIYFAGRSFYLERKIRRLNHFYGKATVHIIDIIDSNNRKYAPLIRFSFTNYSNVKGIIDAVYFKGTPAYRKDKLKLLWERKKIYQYFLVPIRDIKYVLGPQLLPMELWWNETKWIDMHYDRCLKRINDTLITNNCLLKSYVFQDSLWNLYEYKVNNNYFHDFITTNKQLENYKHKERFK